MSLWSTLKPYLSCSIFELWSRVVGVTSCCCCCCRFIMWGLDLGPCACWAPAFPLCCILSPCAFDVCIAINHPLMLLSLHHISFGLECCVFVFICRKHFLISLISSLIFGLFKSRWLNLLTVWILQSFFCNQFLTSCCVCWVHFVWCQSFKIYWDLICGLPYSLSSENITRWQDDKTFQTWEMIHLLILL